MELLAPAGNLEKAKIALIYGADAVYVGGKEFSLRARASNFLRSDLEELVLFGHNLNKKIYVTLNIVPHDSDLVGLDEYLLFLDRICVDAVITTSRYIMKKVKELCKYTTLHVSTQNSISSINSINYYKKYGATRCVLAREVTLNELEYIMNHTDLEIEYFIHGGMCASFSGRCVLSNYMTNRDANRGGCAHSCRWNYNLYKNKSLIGGGYFSMGSKDLMVLKHIPKLIDLNVASLKIEGRMKSPYYLATVVRSYRYLIDKYIEKKELTEEDYNYCETEIKKAENRLTSVGFYEGIPSFNEQLYDNRSERPTKEYVGVVLDYDPITKICLVEQRNYFEKGNKLEFFGPNLENTMMVCEEIIDYKTKEIIDVARHPLQLLEINVPFKVSKNDMIRLVDVTRNS